MKVLLALLLLCLNQTILAQKISFNRDVRPILSDKCYFCHGPDAEDIKGGLQLHTFVKATSDRDGDGPAIVPGNINKSLLWERITTDDEDDVMPPPERHMEMTQEELSIIKKWIEQGAEYETLWSLKHLPQKVKLPNITVSGQHNEIDLFIQKKLMHEGLPPSAKADKNTLLRRLYLSITGLTPTPQQIASFKANKNSNAYEALVDELLKSTGFAERLAVDWMDLSRYAVSYGYQHDRARKVWPWRDWVINAFKNNMPYDHFITQQLAGDLMENSDDNMKLATAFNRLHTQKNEGGSVAEEFRTEYVADRAQTAATAFLGLTMECCRCHDHKYDPLSQEDYFKTFALFNNIDEAGLYSFFTKAVPSPTMPLMSAKEKLDLAIKEESVAQLENKLTGLHNSEKNDFHQWRASWNKKILSKGLIAHFPLGSKKITNLVNQTNSENSNQPLDGKFNPANIKHHVKLSGDSPISFGDLGILRRHQDFSFSLWINTPVHHQRAVIAHRTRSWTDAGSRGYELMMHEGKLSLALIHFSPGNEIRIRSEEKVAVDKWQHITVTYDGSSRASGLKIYLDGKVLKTEVLKDHLTKEISYGDEKKNKLIPFQLGARHRDKGFKKSLVGELRFYDRRLSPLEVRHNFSAKLPAYNSRELFDYWLLAESHVYKDIYSQLMTKRRELNEFKDSRFHMMIMKELPVRRKTYLLKRGLYSSPDFDREVEPGPPEKIFPFGPEYSRDRLGFAQWLTHPQHPLTSRVAVNRFWQMIFGTGIVSTTNDFGSQGALPTHPQLLNYLSRSFVDSGWDIRALIKKNCHVAHFPSALKYDPGALSA